MKDKSLIFLTLGILCFFLVLSQFYGEKYITKFVEGIMPSSSNSTVEEQNFTVENMNTETTDSSDKKEENSSNKKEENSSKGEWV